MRSIERHTHCRAFTNVRMKSLHCGFRSICFGSCCWNYPIKRLLHSFISVHYNGNNWFRKSNKTSGQKVVDEIQRTNPPMERKKTHKQTEPRVVVAVSGTLVAIIQKYFSHLKTSRTELNCLFDHEIEAYIPLFLLHNLMHWARSFIALFARNCIPHTHIHRHCGESSGTSIAEEFMWMLTFAYAELFAYVHDSNIEN